MPGLGEPLIAYAVKANPNLSVLATLARLGAGADTVSEGEIRRALAAGVPPERIVFSGVGKTAARDRLRPRGRRRRDQRRIRAGARSLVEAIAAGRGARAPVAIRVNPDVEAGGHAKISTGKADNKFGVSMAEAERSTPRPPPAPPLRPVGVACHIGSQITDLAPLEAAFVKMRGLVESCAAEGLAVERSTSAAAWACPISTSRTPRPGRLRRHGRRAPWAASTSSSPSSPAG